MALLDEEDDGRKVKKQPKPLDNLGIVELEEYIGALKGS